jgi:hypothetical protein
MKIKKHIRSILNPELDQNTSTFVECTSAPRLVNQNSHPLIKIYGPIVVSKCLG